MAVVMMVMVVAAAAAIVVVVVHLILIHKKCSNVHVCKIQHLHLSAKIRSYVPGELSNTSKAVIAAWASIGGAEAEKQ